MNSQARRVLALYNDRHMLVVREPGSGTWSTLGVIDSEVTAVVRRILANTDRWRPMETSNPERVAEFSSLLGHPNRRLHELAYASLLRVHPGTLPELVRDLTAWRRWELAGQVNAIRQTMGSDDPLGTYAVDRFLRLALANTPKQD